jgi:hypothetical protein
MTIENTAVGLIGGIALLLGLIQTVKYFKTKKKELPRYCTRCGKRIKY